MTGRAARFTSTHAIALVLAVTALAFLPALGAGFVWDDALLIEHNRWLTGNGAAWRALTHSFWDVETVAPGEAVYYRPLVTLTFIALRAVFGLAPMGYHAAVIAMHLAAVALLGRLLARLFDRDPLAVGAGTTLFALHATRAESVVWIVGCTDVLAAISALIAMLLALPPRVNVTAPRPTLARAAGVALFTTTALLAKETALVLPVVLGALCIAVWPAGVSHRRAIGLYAGASSIVVMAYVALRTVWLPLPSATSAPPPVRHAALVFETVGWYARMLVAPWPLSVIRAPVRFADGAIFVSLPYVALGAITLITVITVALVFRARRIDPASAGVAMAGLFLLPVLNVRWLPLVWIAAERYLYLPTLGLAVALGAALVRSGPRGRRIALIALAMLGTAHAVTIALRARDFRDERAFWTAESRLHPDLPVVLAGLARGEIDAGHPGRGVAYLRRAFAESSRVQSGPRLGRDLLRAFDAALIVVPDDDRASLESAAAFYAAMRDPHARVAPARVHGWTFVYDKRVLGDVTPDEASVLRGTEATVLSRLGRLDEARTAALEALRTCTSHCGEIALNAALVCGRARDWQCAFAANARAAREADDGARVARQRAQLETVRAHADEAARAPTDELRALAEAEVDVFLARPEAARVELQRAGQSVRAELLRARVDLLEYHFAEADARIATLRAGAPESAARVFAELAALEARQRARVEGL